MAFEDQKQSKTLKPLQVSVPTEIVQEILFRLPVESLLRCKCVCKLWFSLILDPYFINRHAKTNESAQCHLHRLTLAITTLRSIKTCHVCDVLHGKAINALKIDYPFKHHAKSVSVVGSCNGLICLRFWDNRTYRIWNPSTRRSSERFSPRFDFQLQGKPCWDFGYGFGYDESTDDYKVVEFFCTTNNGTKSDDTLTAHIYSLKSGNRKNFNGFPQGLQVEAGNGTFWNGALHWLARKPQTDGHYLRSVATLDLATETYRGISYPPYNDDKGLSIPILGVLGEWLCVVRTYMEKHGDVWVMKEYRVTNSWVQLFSIPYPTSFKSSKWDVFSVPLCVSDDGNVLLQLGSKLVLYDPKSHSVSEIRRFNIRREAITFVESLVSPDS